MKPFVKWAGGKRQIVDKILRLIDIFAKESDNKYRFFEPFVGGGVVFLTLNHDKVVINDTNEELINSYKTIKNTPKELMRELDIYKEEYLANGESFYYGLRELDRDLNIYDNLSNVEKAARTIFLNKTCYNGLYRVNLKGQFNTPMGRYVNPTMYNKRNIEKMSKYLNNNNIKIMNEDYSEVIKLANQNDIIYVDPPYDYGSDREGFTKYQKEGFNFNDFKRLKLHLDEAINKGAFVIVSNNATNRVIQLFDKDPRYEIIYNYKIINTNRTINSKGNKRTTGKEVLIMGSQVTFPQANSINKIMRLIRLRNEEDLKDIETLKKILRVKSYRQVHYYLTALRFLRLTNKKGEYTEKAKVFRSLRRFLFELEFANYILTFQPFREIYELENSNNIQYLNSEIAYYIKKHFKGYSHSTYVRRASTVRKWVDWCKKTI